MPPTPYSRSHIREVRKWRFRSFLLLWLVLAFLKAYPKDGQFEILAPRRHRGSLHNRYARALVRRGISHLSIVMMETSMDHLFHPSRMKIRVTGLRNHLDSRKSVPSKKKA